MTLTELSYYSRRFMPFVILLFLIFLILFYALKLFFLYLQINKPKSIYINPIFNKIKKLELLDATSSADFSFTIDTIEGQPVTATNSAKVFFLPENNPRFGYREKIYLIAKTLGFDTEEVKHRLVDKEAIFIDEKQKLTVDITNFNFKYEYYLESNPEVLNKPVPPQKKESETKAIDFLKSIGRYPEELAKGKTNAIFLSYNQAEKKMAILENNLNANIIEVDFYRPDIEEYPIVSPKYYNSQNYVLLTFYEDGSYKILRAQVKFFEKSEEQVGIYPLISGDQAYENLKLGKAFVVVSPTEAKNIIIKKMFLGYLDPDFYQQYLQPIYVFLGEKNFVAYVPSVADEYVSD